jgi:hypothetical protein
MSSPVLTDLDKDGDVEVAIAAEHHVFVFDLPAAQDSGTLEWPIYQHDLRLTGWYTSGARNLPPLVSGVHAEPWYVVPGGSVTITAQVRDEDGVASVQAEVESPDENVLVTLTLHDDGAHGDGAAGDGVYGNTWTTPATKQDYVIDVSAQDTPGLSCSHDNVSDFTSSDVPYVQYDSHAIQRESLIADGIPSPGEMVEGTITLRNLGALAAPGVTATVSTHDLNVWWMTVTPLAFGDIAAGSTGTSAAYAFSYQVGYNCPSGYAIPFDLRIEDGLGHVWRDAFDVVVVDTVGPEVYGVNVFPRSLPAGQPVTITAYAQDNSGVAAVKAIIARPGESPAITLTLYDDGAHGDWGAGDGNYGAAWTTDAQEQAYAVDVWAEDTLGNVRTYGDQASFTTKPFSKTADVLVVMDGGGMMTSSVCPYYTRALDDLGVAYDLWDTYLYGAVPSTTMHLYNVHTGGILVWAVPGWGYLCTGQTQEALGGYLDAGGRLFISGQDLAQYAGRSAFYGGYLHGSYVLATSGVSTLAGIPGDPIGDGLRLDISGGDGAGNQDSPDAIQGLAPATDVLTYTAGITGAIKVDTGTYRAVTFGFGFEGINSSSDRAVVMRRVLDWLESPPVNKPHLVYLPVVMRDR